MNLPGLEGNGVNKENQNPKLLSNVQYKKLMIHDKKLENEDIRNPFCLPSNLRIFYLNSKIKKLKPEPYMMCDPRTVCDIDDTFYKVIEGRPLRQFTDVKVYMSNIRDVTLFKADTAYLKDQIVQIKTSFVDETKEYNSIETLFVNLTINFTHFIKNSYDKAKALQEKAVQTSVELAKIIEQLEAYSFEYVKLRNQLFNITVTFETLTMYRNFFNSISPDEWQEQYASVIDCRNIFCDEASANNEVEEFTSSSEVSLDIYKGIIAKLQRIEPRLYFKKPVQ